MAYGQMANLKRTRFEADYDCQRPLARRNYDSPWRAATEQLRLTKEQPMQRDLTCVYRAMDVAEADIVSAWLADQEVSTHVKDRHFGSQLPLTVAPRGIELCVVDPAQAEQVKALVREHLQQRREKAAAPGRVIEAVCEECGKSSRFPFEQRGTVQTCPHCRQYLDVPEA